MLEQGSYQVTSAPLGQGLQPPGRKQADRSMKRHKARFQLGQTRPGLEALTSMSGFQRGVMVARSFQLGFPAYRSARIL